MTQVHQRRNTSIQLWKPLNPGDIVDIVAPASASTNRGLEKAIQFVESLGLVPRVPKDIFGGDNKFCSQSDKYRFRHLQKAIYAKDSKAIWSLRGGWGSARLLPRLTRLKAPEQSKIFIGYSDITSLHLFFNFSWNWPTIHGSMLEELGGRGQVNHRELSDFQKLIFGETDFLQYKGLIPLNNPAHQKKTIKGVIVGGNLTVIQSSLGTPWQMSSRGKIVAIEDIGERGYRVDRMLVHLEQAGFFQGARAIVFGDFVGCEESDSSNLWKEAQNLFAKKSPTPVLKGLPFGHGDSQRPLPLFTPAQLKLGRLSTLKVMSGFIK